MEDIDTLFGDYIRFMFSRDDTNIEYVENHFLHTAARWSGDFVGWYEGTGEFAANGDTPSGRKGVIADILDFESTCEAIRLIQQSEFRMDCTQITPEIVIRNYLNVYLGRLSADDLRSILCN